MADALSVGSPRLMVLGLGNVLCGDDGLGIEAVCRLLAGYHIGEGVRVLDGGTLGLSLLGLFERDEDVLLVDAIRADGPAGTLVRLEADDVAPAMRERLSVHQVGVVDLLDALRLLDRFPRRLTLLGLIPETLELGLDRSPAVEARLPELVAAVADEIRRTGHAISARNGDATNADVGDDRLAARSAGL